MPRENWAWGVRNEQGISHLPKFSYVRIALIRYNCVQVNSRKEKMIEKTHKIAYGNADLTISQGNLAMQADAAVTVCWGETMVLATVVVSNEVREEIDFLPLLIDYEERMYASGKISGSRFIKREGRPSDNAVLTARMIDRPLRPLFPKYFYNDVQVVITVLSYDKEHDPSIVSIIAASSALMLSKAPFAGPVGAARIGRIDGKLIANPTDQEIKKSDLELVIASVKDKIIMVEAEGVEIPEEVMKEAFQLAQKEIQPILKMQTDLAKDAVSLQVEPLDEKIHSELKDFVGAELKEVLKLKQDDEQKQKIADFELRILNNFEGNYKQIELKSAFGKLIQKEVRKTILEDGIRPDGRRLDEIRPISVEVGILPRTHGSGLFTRGHTQSLTIATLGAPGDEQFVDTMEEEGTRRYMHHYNFPPFSTGEVSPMRSTSRREIGHGALAEKALLPMVPSKEDFPYTIRLVSEILSSNGSSSMAATCGSTLALLDAGVPLKALVAGIAIGLITRENFNGIKATDVKDSDYKILTDIQGLEDFGGDMDFKVAGTKNGITAIQMDTKLHGITFEIASRAMDIAKVARLKILEKMLAVIPREKEMSQYAPRIKKIIINPKRIGDIIGPGGKTIRKIIETCGGDEKVSIDIDDQGCVYISATDKEAGDQAKKIIEELTYEVKVGQVFDNAKVVEIVKQRDSGAEIGALVEVAPGRIGMVHISEVSPERIPTVSSVLKIGQIVKVKVVTVDEEKGRYGLSIKRA